MNNLRPAFEKYFKPKQNYKVDNIRYTWWLNAARKRTFFDTLPQTLKFLWLVYLRWWRSKRLDWNNRSASNENTAFFSICFCSA